MYAWIHPLLIVPPPTPHLHPFANKALPQAALLNEGVAQPPCYQAAKQTPQLKTTDPEGSLGVG